MNKEDKIKILCNVYIVDPKGVDDLRKIKEFDVLTIYLKADEEIRARRLIYREEAKSTFGCSKSYEIADERIMHDKETFKVIKTDYVVDSGRDSEKTLRDVIDILQVEESNK